MRWPMAPGPANGLSPRGGHVTAHGPGMKEEGDRANIGREARGWLTGAVAVEFAAALDALNEGPFGTQVAPRASVRGRGPSPVADAPAAARLRKSSVPLIRRPRTTMTGEARTPVSPTPSVVDRDRRCRSAIAMRSPLFDSRRPV